MLYVMDIYFAKSAELHNYKNFICEPAFFDTIFMLAIEIESIIVKVAYLNSPRREGEK